MLAEDPALAPAPTATAVAPLPVRPADVEPLAVGEQVPEVSVRNSNGEPVELRSLLGEGKLVIVFYRGGWCPYCNSHLADLKKIEPQISAKGARLIGICMDRPELIARYEAEHPLPFPLYSDGAADAIRAFRVAYRVTDDEVERLRSAGIDLIESSGHAHKLLPAPAVFIASKEGRLVYTFHSADYRKRIEPKDLLKALELGN